jgi:hypothetical protein
VKKITQELEMQFNDKEDVCTPLLHGREVYAEQLSVQPADIQCSGKAIYHLGKDEACLPPSSSPRLASPFQQLPLR